MLRIVQGRQAQVLVESALLVQILLYPGHGLTLQGTENLQKYLLNTILHYKDSQRKLSH